MGFGYFPYTIPDGTNPNIYDANGNLLLQIIRESAVKTNVKGMDGTGDDLDIYANSANAYPKIRLLGNQGIYFNYQVGTYFILADGATISHRFTYAANVSNIYGGIVTGDTTKVFANVTDAYPFIEYEGNANINIHAKGDISFYDQATFLGEITSEKTLKLAETTTPTAHAAAGQFYTKNDNKAYFQDGAGVEHTLAFV